MWKQLDTFHCLSRLCTCLMNSWQWIDNFVIVTLSSYLTFSIVPSALFFGKNIAPTRRWWWGRYKFYRIINVLVLISYIFVESQSKYDWIINQLTMTHILNSAHSFLKSESTKNVIFEVICHLTYLFYNSITSSNVSNI